MKPKGTLLINRSQIASLMTLDEYIAGVEDAFRMYAEGKTLAPGLMHVDAPDGEFHIKGGGLSLGRTYFALKLNGSFFGNPKRNGMPAIQGTISLCDGDTGYPLALMDSGEITIQRTGAATAVAAKYLARRDAKVATICGCGNQGRIQLRGLTRVRSIEKAFAYDVEPERAQDYAVRMNKELGFPVTAVTDLGAAAQQSDIVVTCTPSKKAYLMASYIRPGTFVSAIGADSPDKQEVESVLLVGNKVVVDILAQCAHVGELHHAIEQELLTEEAVHGELGAIIAGQIPGRTSDSEIVVFDATGTALQDAAAAAVVYEKAVKAGIGTTFDFAS